MCVLCVLCLVAVVSTESTTFTLLSAHGHHRLSPSETSVCAKVTGIWDISVHRLQGTAQIQFDRYLQTYEGNQEVFCAWLRDSVVVILNRLVYYVRDEDPVSPSFDDLTVQVCCLL